MPSYRQISRSTRHKTGYFGDALHTISGLIVRERASETSGSYLLVAADVVLLVKLKSNVTVDKK